MTGQRILTALAILFFASCASVGNGSAPGKVRLGAALFESYPQSVGAPMSAGSGVGVDVGYGVLREGKLALEVEGTAQVSRHEETIQTVTFENGAPQWTVVNGDPLNTKLGLGARAIFGKETSAVSPFLRGGAMYQELSDDGRQRDGFGFYTGVGLEIAAGPVTLEPQVLYTNASLDGGRMDEFVLMLGISRRF